MKKVLIVFGTRPESIKLAPVIKELQKYSDKINSIVCVTAQHRLMLDQVLDLFEIEPDYDLDLMQPNQTLFDLSAEGLKGLEKLINIESPDLILVQGDTTTAFIAGLSAFYHKIPVGHVEAGLRTGEKYNPFPEEINRKMISTLTDLHFAPTESNRNNLLKENVPAEKIFVTGNTVIDALYMVVNKQIPLNGFGLEKLDFNKHIIMVTAHRRETFGKYIREICLALSELATRRREVEIVYPVHMNPNIRQPVEELIGGVPNIHLVEPLPYGLFITFLNKCYLVLTDSGGIQEEAPSLGKPVLVLRDITERPEAVSAGTVKIIGRESKNIVYETNVLIDDEYSYNKMARAVNPYGDGKAADRIANHILNFLKIINVI